MSRVLGVRALLLRSENPRALADFYEALLGLVWTATHDGGFVSDTDGLHWAIVPGRGGGIRQARLAVVVEVDEVDDALSRLPGDARALVRDRYDTPEGQFSFLFDPDGNELGLFSPVRQEESRAEER